MRQWRKGASGKVTSEYASPKPYVAEVMHPAGLDKPLRLSRKPTAVETFALDVSSLNAYNTKGLHGGGECPVRKTQRTSPRKGGTWRGRQAHRWPYGPKRTW